LAPDEEGRWQRLDELGRALAADAAAQSRDTAVLRRVRACSSAIAVMARKVLEYRRWQSIGAEGTTRMSLLIVYVVLVIAGDLVCLSSWARD